MNDRPLTPIEEGRATPGGYWCLQCNNAGKNQQHECAGPCTVAGRSYNCSCKEKHDR